MVLVDVALLDVALLDDALGEASSLHAANAAHSAAPQQANPIFAMLFIR